MHKAAPSILFAFALLSPVSSPCGPADSQQHAAEHKHQSRTPEADRDRWYWQMPHRVMNEIGIREGMVVADIGAGEGYFATRLAARVGISGKVYANDVDE